MQQEISEPPAPGTATASLAIEVIGRDGSIALLDGTSVIAARSLVDGSRAAASLAPAIADLAARYLPGGTLDALRYVAVASGPGSFTGLRIAVTTAKTLAYALEIPLVAVNSLTAIADLAAPHSTPPAPGERQRTAPPRPVLVGLAAYRGQAYRGRFLPGRAPEIDIVSAAQWRREVLHSAETAMEDAGNSDRNNFIFAGDRAIFASAGVSIDSASWCGDDVVRAVGVGRVAAGMHWRGETTNPIELVPDYLRPSSAEEKVG